MSEVEELARKERQEYFRKWRRENPQKVKKHNQDYWMRKAERKLADRKLAEQQAEAN